MTAHCPALQGCGRWRRQHRHLEGVLVTAFLKEHISESLRAQPASGGDPAGMPACWQRGRTWGGPFIWDTVRPRVERSHEHSTCYTSGLALRWWPRRDQAGYLSLTGVCHLCAVRGHTACPRACHLWGTPQTPSHTLRPQATALTSTQHPTCSGGQDGCADTSNQKQLALPLHPHPSCPA